MAVNKPGDTIQTIPDYTEMRNRYLPWIRNLIKRHNGDIEIAEDLLHDAWLVMLEKPLPNLHSATAASYFLGIVKFKWYTRLRNQGRFLKAVETIELDVAVNEETLEPIEHYNNVDSVFKRMKSACQYIIYSVYWLAKPLWEVQAQLNHKSSQSTFNAKHRCLQAFKKELVK
jgi:DNA-directed RNA polymerase specialized sigma24 family protein